MFPAPLSANFIHPLPYFPLFWTWKKTRRLFFTGFFTSHIHRSNEKELSFLPDAAAAAARRGGGGLYIYFLDLPLLPRALLQPRLEKRGIILLTKSSTLFAELFFSRVGQFFIWFFSCSFSWLWKWRKKEIFFKTEIRITDIFKGRSTLFTSTAGQLLKLGGYRN